MELPLNGISVGLDCGKGDISFLSHAHGDHTSGLRRRETLITSDETLALSGLPASRYEGNGFSLLDAGHILGSRQLFAESDGRSSLYTGDFRLKDGIFGKGAEAREADRLIIECTYGHPKFSFPEPFDVYDDIAKWASSNKGSILLIGAYNLGKAQEIIRVLNEYCSITPIVMESTERFNQVYDKFGQKLDRAVVGTDEAEEIMRDGFVAVVPPRTATQSFAYGLSKAFGRRALTAAATGWALAHRVRADKKFPLSDHADFPDIVSFVEQVAPKEIKFVHGDGSMLEVELKKRGLISPFSP